VKLCCLLASAVHTSVSLAAEVWLSGYLAKQLVKHLMSMQLHNDIAKRHMQPVGTAIRKLVLVPGLDMQAVVACRVLACLAVMLVLQSQWPMQQHSLLPDHQWQGSIMGPGSSRHLMAVDALAPAMSQGALGGGGNAGRPDWVRCTPWHSCLLQACSDVGKHMILTWH